MTTMLQGDEAKEVDPLRSCEFTMTLRASEEALQRVRNDQNSTRSLDVGRFKLYVAGLITLCAGMQEKAQKEKTRCALKAIDHLEEALMYAEKALLTK